MLQKLFWERNGGSVKLRRSLHTSEGLQGRMNEGDPSIIRSSEWRDDTWQRPCCCSTIRGTRHGRRRAHSRAIRRRSIQMGLQELRNIHTIPRASAIIITTTTTNKLLQAACLRFPVMCNAVSSPQARAPSLPRLLLLFPYFFISFLPIRCRPVWHL